MSIEEFTASLENATPPSHVSDLLKAMWYDAKGDWNTSHDIAQEIQSREGSWIHAYLHRKEGDAGNASYWYHKAGQPVCHASLEKEWETLVLEFLKRER